MTKIEWTEMPSQPDRSRAPTSPWFGISMGLIGLIIGVILVLVLRSTAQAQGVQANIFDAPAAAPAPMGGCGCGGGNGCGMMN